MSSVDLQLLLVIELNGNLILNYRPCAARRRVKLLEEQLQLFPGASGPQGQMLPGPWRCSLQDCASRTECCPTAKCPEGPGWRKGLFWRQDSILGLWHHRNCAWPCCVDMKNEFQNRNVGDYRHAEGKLAFLLR